MDFIDNLRALVLSQLALATATPRRSASSSTGLWRCLARLWW